MGLVPAGGWFSVRVETLCEPLLVSTVEVTQSTWLRRKTAYLSASLGHHSIACAPWESGPSTNKRSLCLADDLKHIYWSFAIKKRYWFHLREI